MPSKSIGRDIETKLNVMHSIVISTGDCQLKGEISLMCFYWVFVLDCRPKR
ncbi:protein of unknown function [Candidatus Nitrosacidococcus tergens]|uniref:Uncharacterized protein n=1 Tax=Candidatus Nitrosacidococcus tergens TaxID=553981 RepID=A0A7G1QA27_9GAMM|nr:protein of unknown function [Candidatus Nitrosacidococcus tergens]